jgi:hypothetical protein
MSNFVCDWAPSHNKIHDTHLSKHRTTQHGGRIGGQESVRMFCHETTVCFSPAIDRRIVSVVIFRGLCDVWSTEMNSATFVTDDQNALSLCQCVKQHWFWTSPTNK